MHVHSPNAHANKMQHACTSVKLRYWCTDGSPALSGGFELDSALKHACASLIPSGVSTGKLARLRFKALGRHHAPCYPRMRWVWVLTLDSALKPACTPFILSGVGARMACSATFQGAPSAPRALRPPFAPDMGCRAPARGERQAAWGDGQGAG